MVSQESKLLIYESKKCGVMLPLKHRLIYVAESHSQKFPLLGNGIHWYYHGNIYKAFCFKRESKLSNIFSWFNRVSKIRGHSKVFQTIMLIQGFQPNLDLQKLQQMMVFQEVSKPSVSMYKN